MSDLLVVTSKIKQTIKARGGMNTSGEAVHVMSKVIEKICGDAIECARKDGRRTVMDRDVRAVFTPANPQVQ